MPNTTRPHTHSRAHIRSPLHVPDQPSKWFRRRICKAVALAVVSPSAHTSCHTRTASADAAAHTSCIPLTSFTPLFAHQTAPPFTLGEGALHPRFPHHPAPPFTPGRGALLLRAGQLLCGRRRRQHAAARGICPLTLALTRFSRLIEPMLRPRCRCAEAEVRGRCQSVR